MELHQIEEMMMKDTILYRESDEVLNVLVGQFSADVILFAYNSLDVTDKISQAMLE